MRDRAQVISRIYQAIDEVNLQLPPDQQVGRSEHTVLLGEDGGLDSLAFLNLIVATEEAIGSWSGDSIALASRLMESEKGRLPRTVADLADLICGFLDDHNDD